MTPTQWKKLGKSFQFEEQSIFYIDSGPALDKPLLLCIHGFPTSSFDFHLIWPQLTEHYRVVAFDMLGFGFSSKPANWEYTCMQQADIAEALLRQLQCKEFTLLAHDLGDTVGQELLARHNEQRLAAELHKVVFLNGGLCPEMHRPILVQRLLLTPFGSLIVRLMGFKNFKKSLQSVCMNQFPEQEVKYAWEILNESNGRLRLNLLIRYIPERIRHRSRWVDALSEAKCPVYLIDGVEDPVSGGHLVDRVEQLAPKVNVTRLAGLGHYPHVENPSRFWVALEAALRA